MLTAACLALIALLHAYWGFGGRWPGRDARTLGELVVGRPEMASPSACHAVALLLSLAAVFVLGASGAPSLPVPGWLVLVGGWTPVMLLGLRGLVGFFEAPLRPEILGLPYQRWSLRLYSPLCLSIAILGAIEIS